MIAVLSFSAATAQRTFDIIVNAGLGTSFYIGGDANFTKPLFAYRLGVGLNFPIKGDVLGFQPGLNLLGNGTAFDTKIEDASSSIHQVYLELPLMLTSRVKATNDLGVVFNYGPYMALGVGGKVKVSDGEYSESSKTFGDMGSPSRFDFGLGFGVNFDMNRIMFGVDTRFGLLNLFRGDFYDPSLKMKNFALLFNVGYRF